MVGGESLRVEGAVLCNAWDVDTDSVRALRAFLSRFRYRELPELIGMSFDVADPGDFANVFARQVRGFSGRLLQPDSREALLGALIKYGIVDATVECDASLLNGPDSRGGRRAYRELFPADEDEAVDALRTEDGEPGAQWLLEDLVSHALLRVWMVEEDWEPKPLAEKGRAVVEFQRSGGVPDGLFPARITIQDACFTNLSSAWLSKHFYL